MSHYIVSSAPHQVMRDTWVNPETGLVEQRDVSQYMYGDPVDRSVIGFISVEIPKEGDTIEIGIGLRHPPDGDRIESVIYSKDVSERYGLKKAFYNMVKLAHS